VTKSGQLPQNAVSTAAQVELVSGEALWQGLGYRTAAAFRQAVHRKTVPIHVFSLPNRRGKHAFKADLDQWVSELVASQAAGQLDKATGGGTP
jgi:hypothetical protein